MCVVCVYLCVCVCGKSGSRHIYNTLQHLQSASFTATAIGGVGGGGGDHALGGPRLLLHQHKSAGLSATAPIYTHKRGEAGEEGGWGGSSSGGGMAAEREGAGVGRVRERVKGGKGGGGGGAGRRKGKGAMMSLFCGGDEDLDAVWPLLRRY